MAISCTECSLVKCDFYVYYIGVYVFYNISVYIFIILNVDPKARHEPDAMVNRAIYCKKTNSSLSNSLYR